MIRALQWILGILTLICVLYAVAINSQDTSISYFPGIEPLSAPLYLIILITFATGFLIGTIYLWLGQLPGRLEARKERKSLEKENKKLEKDLDTYIEKEAEFTQDRLEQENY